MNGENTNESTFRNHYDERAFAMQDYNDGPVVAPKEPNVTEVLDEILKRLYEIRDEVEQAHEKLGCFTHRLERKNTEPSYENIHTTPNIFPKIDLIKRELTFMYNMAINIRKRV